MRKASGRDQSPPDPPSPLCPAAHESACGGREALLREVWGGPVPQGVLAPLGHSPSDHTNTPFPWRGLTSRSPTRPWPGGPCVQVSGSTTTAAGSGASPLTCRECVPRGVLRAPRALFPLVAPAPLGAGPLLHFTVEEAGVPGVS